MERRRLDLRSFDEVIAEVDRLHTQGYTKAAQWDLSQVCQHLTESLRQALEGYTFKPPWYLRPLAPMFRRQIFRDRRFGQNLPTGKDLVFPSADEGQSIAEFKAMLQQFRNAEQYLPSPFFGPRPVDEVRDFHLIHASHHLSCLIAKQA